jgi:hypothetical protein
VVVDTSGPGSIVEQVGDRPSASVVDYVGEVAEVVVEEDVPGTSNSVSLIAVPWWPVCVGKILMPEVGVSNEDAVLSMKPVFVPLVGPSMGSLGSSGSSSSGSPS